MKIFKPFICLLSILIFSCESKRESRLIKEQEVKAEAKVSEVSASVVPSVCTITREENTLYLELFPFEFKDFRTSHLKKFFSDKVTIDSATLTNEGYTYTRYVFKKDDSFVTFYVNPNEDAKPWFTYGESSIDNDLLKFKNEIKIGMDNKEVFSILEINPMNCDTLSLQEGDLFTYYDFIFQNSKLQKVYIFPTE